MAPLQTVQKFRLLVVSKGGQPGGLESEICDDVRTRLARFRSGTGEQALAHFLWDICPLYAYTDACVGVSTFAALSSGQRAELVFDLFKAAVWKTRLPTRYAQVIDSEMNWNVVEAAITNCFESGATTVEPAVERTVARTGSKASTPTARQAEQGHWMTSRRMLCGSASVAATVYCYIEQQLATSGRDRFTNVVKTLLLIVNPKNPAQTSAQDNADALTVVDSESEASDAPEGQSAGVDSSAVATLVGQNQ